jgi:hypothetical protein
MEGRQCTFEALDAASGDRDRGAFGCEHVRDRIADSLARAVDDRHLSVQL